ncbi:MAG: 6-carboxytetrahydropterin synthase [Planctomycetota bacterium]|nr:6-carboxytetrahydropterin synthase [Planctomycetota bacterium]
MIELTRSVEFSASHRLHNPALSDEENRDIFGVCNNLHGHGHNYVLDVTLRGEVDPKTGMVMDLNHLHGLLDELIVKELDHKHFNEDVSWLKGSVTTAETVIAAMWTRLSDPLEGKLHHLRLYESRHNFVDYFGPDQASIS